MDKTSDPGPMVRGNFCFAYWGDSQSHRKQDIASASVTPVEVGLERGRKAARRQASVGERQDGEGAGT